MCLLFLFLILRSSFLGECLAKSVISTCISVLSCLSAPSYVAHHDNCFQSIQDTCHAWWRCLLVERRSGPPAVAWSASATLPAPDSVQQQTGEQPRSRLQTHARPSSRIGPHVVRRQCGGGSTERVGSDEAVRIRRSSIGTGWLLRARGDHRSE